MMDRSGAMGVQACSRSEHASHPCNRPRTALLLLRDRPRDHSGFRMPNHPLPLIGTLPMTTCALLVELKAKPGKEEELASFLASARPLAEAEPDTVTWFAVRLDIHTFAIFDAFDHEAGRQAHLSGPIAAALMAHADALLAVPPSIRKADVLADVLPG
jgi:quinol monooxygenase YgiN